MTRLKVISFDADQTLFDFGRTMKEALGEVSDFLDRTHGLEISAATLRQTRDRIAAEHSGQAIDMLEMRRLSFVEILKGHPKADDIVPIAMEVFKAARFGRVYLFPQVEQVIVTLSKTYTLIVLTNGNSTPEKTPLAAMFDHTILGEKFAFKKPDRRIFEHMFAVAGISDPATVCHVGDQLVADIQGANEVGATSVWFNPEGQPNTTSISPTHEISSMEDLLEIPGI